MTSQQVLSISVPQDSMCEITEMHPHLNRGLALLLLLLPLDAGMLLLPPPAATTGRTRFIPSLRHRYCTIQG